MKTNTELIANLKAAMTAIPADDESASVKLAVGHALLDYLTNGHCLTDLDWFKGTSYYTGACSDELLKAA